MIDILAVCAHPDDLEVCAAGIFAKAKKEGMKTGLVIFTKGESGGYAQKCEREAEAVKASEILQLDYFAMLDFPDAGVFFTQEMLDYIPGRLRRMGMVSRRRRFWRFWRNTNRYTGKTEYSGFLMK